MKIFLRDGCSVNFVDSNNVFLGYNLGQCCCENADWFISDKPESKSDAGSNEISSEELEGFVFDTSYFEEVTDGYFDGGGMVIFRMVRGQEERFIHLYNIQNGYYGHGFEFVVDGKKVQEGGI